VGKHTPGPWEKDHLGTRGHVKAIINDDERATPTVCKYGRDYCAMTIKDEEIEANGHLMAAAPDMLQALKAVQAAITKHAEETGDVIWINPPYQAAAVHESAWERLETVIAKAEGRECIETFDCANGAHADCCPAKQ